MDLQLGVFVWVDHGEQEGSAGSREDYVRHSAAMNECQSLVEIWNLLGAVLSCLIVVESRGSAVTFNELTPGTTFASSCFCPHSTTRFEPIALSYTVTVRPRLSSMPVHDSPRLL